MALCRRVRVVFAPRDCDFVASRRTNTLRTVGFFTQFVKTNGSPHVFNKFCFNKG